ncbi:MAG: hypothetical protein ACRDRS_07470 [Pseudonocardiaceae bacterium]
MTNTTTDVPTQPTDNRRDAERTARQLPEGVFHLLIADDDLVHRACRMRVTVCGELVQPSSLPPSCFNEEGEGYRDPRYCPECVSEALRWSAEATR